MMQAAVRVFAEQGYHAATVRDIVDEAGVAIGTFYFYFPDKETLFVHLFDETANFLIKAIDQAMSSKSSLPDQIEAAVTAYINVALYEPAVIQLLLVGGVGTVPALAERRIEYREKLMRSWQRALTTALSQKLIEPQNVRRTAEGLVGALDEMVLNLLMSPGAEHEGARAVRDMTMFALRATGYRDTTSP